jgi:hypothetical protein
MNSDARPERDRPHRERTPFLETDFDIRKAPEL